MASAELRIDSFGHIISKDNKDYHIRFKENIDIIDVKSYKKYNKIRENSSEDDLEYEESSEDNEEEGEDEEDYNGKKKHFIDDYQKTDIESFTNKDPKSFSKGGCYIF